MVPWMTHHFSHVDFTRTFYYPVGQLEGSIVCIFTARVYEECSFHGYTQLAIRELLDRLTILTI